MNYRVLSPLGPTSALVWDMSGACGISQCLFVIWPASCFVGVLSRFEELPVLYLSAKEILRGLLTFQLPGFEDLSDG